MQFFSGFSWAVPLAFSDAIAYCRFEEGDTLYDSGKAYELPWSKAREQFHNFIQVRFPARTNTGTNTSQLGVFESNWKAEIKLDLYRGDKQTAIKHISSTQGRLYYALWKGDLGFLDLNNPEPKLPQNVKYVTKNLESVTSTLRIYTNNKLAFVLPRDLSNQVSRDKNSKIFDKLKKHIEIEPKLISPKEAGFENWDVIAPTIEIVIFATSGLRRNELTDLIKSALNEGNNKPPKNFRLKPHGIIVE